MADEQQYDPSKIIVYPATREGNMQRVYELLARVVKRQAQQTAPAGVQSPAEQVSKAA